MIDPISVLILSWKSPRTLHNTLSSYRDNGLLNLTDDVIIFFQEVSDADLAIAEEFNITNIISSDKNIGIGPAIELLIKAAKYDTVLFLEEDWVTKEEFFTVKMHLSDALYLILSGRADFVRLRSVNNPGAPLYTLQFKDCPMNSTEHLIEQVHSYRWGIDKIAPGIFTTWHGRYTGGFVIGDSFYSNYSNNPFVCKKSFWLNNIGVVDKGGISLEGEVRKTWRQSGYKVAYGIPGLFTHQRL